MIMRLSTKGQVTIPLEIRAQAGIGPGSAVDIEFRDGEIHLRSVPAQEPTSGQRAVALLRAARVKPSMTTEEIMALTRGWGEPDEDRAHDLAP